MAAKSRPAGNIKKIRNLRRISQVFFFLLFILLLYLTEFSFTSADKPGEITAPSQWLNLFYNIDPLSGFVTGISAWVLLSTLLLGLILIVGTVFFGRFFCGWVCPLGTLNHAMSSFKSERKERKGKRLIEANKYHRYQGWKYYILFGIIALAIAGSVQIGLFDPVVIAGRSIGLVVIPALNSAINSIGETLSDSSFSVFRFMGAAIFKISSGLITYLKEPHFHGIFWLALIFLLILIGNRIFTRFWCRGFCPLGAFLGLISRYSIFGLYKDQEKCDGCNLCLLHCQGGDDPHQDVPHRRAECHLCLNCKTECPQNALSFKFQPYRKQYNPKPDLTTRRTILAGMAGLVAFPIIRSGDDSASEATFIRPPGSLIEDDFLKQCIRCGQCMKICPTNALHPALLETGWEGIFSPVLMARIGYCEHYCTLCGEICPTGAIKELRSEDKFGSSSPPPVKIGTAFFDKGRCLPWAFGTTCIVCEEWCPTSPKAIWLEDTEIVDRHGNIKTIRLPHVDIDKCTGCGACEYACPVSGDSAIYVTSAGETRDPEKSLLLRKRK
jgi:MauM/NapG family ferredoxin protein